MTTICPVCDEGDAVQKVQAVVSGGTATGAFSGPSGGVTYSGGRFGALGAFTTISGTSETELAKMLKPPPPLKKPKGLGNTGIFFGGCGLFVIAGVSFTLLAIIEPLIPTGISGNNLAPALGWVGFCGIAAFPAFCVIYILNTMGKRRMKASKRDYNQEKPRWDLAMQKWLRLYYCHRDGLVFDPETLETCKPQELKEFLYNGLYISTTE